MGRAILLLALLAAPRLLAASSDPGLETQTRVRRVCVQMGVRAFESQPGSHSAAVESARLGGGAIVSLTGRSGGGFVEVQVLHGGTVWVAATDADSGSPSLCIPQATIMRACGDRSDEGGVPAFDKPSATAALAFRIPAESRVQVWDYFPDSGRWTLVERDGRLGFVWSSVLCLTIAHPPGSDATEHFHMRPAPANTECYQSGRARGANEIRRIVIHNSEATIQRTIATFQACDVSHPASAHVGIDRDGTIYRFVDDRYGAFHTGGNDGGFNAGSLGIEVVASGHRGSRSMTGRQERALIALIRYWSRQYHIVMPRTILSNSSRSRAYNSVEFWQAPITIHRLISAGRRTDCPTFVWSDSAKGDDAFFQWRRTRLR